VIERLKWLVEKKATFFLNVSGGKDSVVAASVAVEQIRSLDPGARIYALYAHTPLALYENLKYVEKLAEWLKVPLIVARPREGLEVLAYRGFPSPLRRWCMYRWKFEPMFEAAARLPPPRVHVVGVRLSESKRRAMVFGGRVEERVWYYCNKWHDYCAYYYAPILEWSREDVLKYIEEKSLPKNPLWGEDGHSSHDCAICICYASFEDWLIFKQKHPELWEKVYSMYRELNEKHKWRKRKLLAWNWVDLDDVARTPSLEDFA
jgi:3'-phosphoadenosine 5'-phosphosulfate sulfotransferase (PAPS reductase)/FAD synthetase